MGDAAAKVAKQPWRVGRGYAGDHPYSLATPMCTFCAVRKPAANETAYSWSAAAGFFDCYKMPRFHFRLFDDVEFPDPEGDELSSLASARTVAVLNARVTAALRMQQKRRLNPDNRIVIEDERGNVLETVYFHDVLVTEDPGS